MMLIVYFQTNWVTTHQLLSHQIRETAQFLYEETIFIIKRFIKTIFNLTKYIYYQICVYIYFDQSNIIRVFLRSIFNDLINYYYYYCLT